MVVGNPLWPDSVLRLLMSPLIYMMGFAIGNLLAVPVDSGGVWKLAAWEMLRAVGTMSVLLAVLALLLVVCT